MLSLRSNSKKTAAPAYISQAVDLKSTNLALLTIHNPVNRPTLRRLYANA